MEDITHYSQIIMVKFRYQTNKAGSRADNAVQRVQESSRDTNVKRITVVQPALANGPIWRCAYLTYQGERCHGSKSLCGNCKLFCSSLVFHVCGVECRLRLSHYDCSQMLLLQRVSS